MRCSMQMRSLLFGPVINHVELGLPWDDWMPNPAEFTPERIALCEQAFLTFAYFDRAGGNYATDAHAIAPLAGRFTHCPDGKKTALEEVSSYVANEFLGDLAVAAAGAGVEVEYTFDEFLKKEIFKDFKKSTITALSDHPLDGENVSIIGSIKYENRDFWNVPTAIVADAPYFPSWDYYSVGNGLDGTNAVLQYFYQHIYAGPHELVNLIYKYLLTADAHKRENFLGLVGQMLSTCRPFTEWFEDGIDCRNLVHERYCDVIHYSDAVIDAAVATARAKDHAAALIAVPGDYANANASADAAEQRVRNAYAEPDYILTRKGIETILFYAGYFAWNGPDEHPLIADWQANLAWLYAHDADAYSKIYTH